MSLYSLPIGSDEKAKEHKTLKSSNVNM